MPVLETITQPVAIQGVEGSYHEIAAQKFFGKEIRLDMCNSFPELFRSLESGKAAFGVMAIENSVAGSLLPNYALLRDSEFAIVGEVYLRIEHCLMAMPGQKIEDLKEAHSHPMAIQQCQAFFKKYPHIKLVEREDTAGSAAWIVEKSKKKVAAIAGELAAEKYQLEILSKGIETNKRNFTRFLVMVSKLEAKNWKLQADKASLCFNLSHSVGSLSQILQVLSAYGMNLSKIQSSPIVGKEWQYFFHIDLEFENFQQYRLSLDAIRPLVNGLKILGEYPRGNKNVS